jgi:hypothetical protein
MGRGRNVSSLRDLADALVDLDVPPEQLRADPGGRTWLPDPLRALVDADPRAQAMLRRAVELELALHDQAAASSDPLFTARVLRALPPVERPRSDRRTFILAAAHALALGAAYLLIWPQYQAGRFAPWVGDAQSWLDGSMSALGSAGLAGVAALSLASMLLLLPRFASGQLGRET